MAVTKYIWDVENDSYLAETDEADVTTAVYTNEPNSFGTLISQHRGTETSYHQFDGIGSTRELTDSDETVTDTFTCNAFGLPIERTGLTFTPFTYVGSRGYYYDIDTETYYIRSRVYLPTSGRFASIDSLPTAHRILLQGYSYSRNSPVTRIDPSGADSLEDKFKQCQTAMSDPIVKQVADCLKNINDANPGKPPCVINTYCKCCKGVYGCAFIEKKGRVIVNVCYNHTNKLHGASEVLKHELHHALRLCHKKQTDALPLTNSCLRCIEEELLAYICSGDPRCKDLRTVTGIGECLSAAGSSCQSGPLRGDPIPKGRPGGAPPVNEPKDATACAENVQEGGKKNIKCVKKQAENLLDNLSDKETFEKLKEYFREFRPAFCTKFLKDCPVDIPRIPIDEPPR